MNCHCVCGFFLVKNPCHLSLVIMEAWMNKNQEFRRVREDGVLTLQ